MPAARSSSGYAGGGPASNAGGSSTDHPSAGADGPSFTGPVPPTSRPRPIRSAGRAWRSSEPRSPTHWHIRLTVRWSGREGTVTSGLGVADWKGRLPRQGDGERGAASRTAHDVDPSAVRFGDPFANGEPQARPRPHTGAGACRVGAPEAVEDVRQVAGRDADPGVGDAEGEFAVGGTKLQAHAAARRRVFHGVGEEIEDQLANPGRSEEHTSELQSQ